MIRGLRVFEWKVLVAYPFWEPRVELIGYGFWWRLLMLRLLVESSRLRKTLRPGKAREHDLTGKAYEASYWRGRDAVVSFSGLYGWGRAWRHFVDAGN